MRKLLTIYICLIWYLCAFQLKKEKLISSVNINMPHCINSLGDVAIAEEKINCLLKRNNIDDKARLLSFSIYGE